MPPLLFEGPQCCGRREHVQRVVRGVWYVVSWVGLIGQSGICAQLVGPSNSPCSAARRPKAPWSSMPSATPNE